MSIYIHSPDPVQTEDFNATADEGEGGEEMQHFKCCPLRFLVCAILLAVAASSLQLTGKHLNQ